MSTWNKKQRTAMGKVQAKLDRPKTQVHCRKCDKIHKPPVCKARGTA